jgi:hypothetical protein
MCDGQHGLKADPLSWLQEPAPCLLISPADNNDAGLPLNILHKL